MSNTRKNHILFLIFSLLNLFVFLQFMGFFPSSPKEHYEYKGPVTSDVISDIEQLSPKTKELALEFLARCEAEGLPVQITETYRTQERQNALYEQGRSLPGPIVTWTKNSKHTQGLAFDICKAGGDPYGDDDFFRRCAEIGREVGLSPGYFWEKNPDKPHYQYNP